MGKLSSFQDKYTKNSYPFPSDDIDPALKDEPEWNLAWLEAIMQQYFSNLCGIRFETAQRIQELREYMEGRQSSTKYKNFFLGKEIPGERRKGWLNVNFDEIFSPAPKIKSKIMGIMEGIEHDIMVDAIDEKSGAAKERAKEELWFKRKFKPYLDKIDQALGLPENEEILPESREELELFAEIGGFKLSYEIFMEKCLGHTFDISNHPENKRRIIGDLIDIGSAAVMDEVNREEQKVYERYIDIADLIIDDDGSNDFKKSRFGAIPLSYTFADIEAETGISEAKLVALAQRYSGRYGNPQWLASYSSRINKTWAFSSWRVPVIYGAYKTVNKKYNTKKNGKLYPAMYGKVWDSETKKTIVTSVQVVYHAKWIPDTEIIWDYGIMNDIPRDEKGNANLPFHVYKIPGKSIGEQLVPILDDIQMIKLRYQNSIAKAPPPGIAVDTEALENISFGDKKMRPHEVINMYFQSGCFVYSKKAAGGNPGITQTKPFEVLSGGAGTIITETAAAMSLAFSQISSITGIDAVTLADETPKSGTTLGQTEVAIAATNSTLKPIYSGYISIKESFANNAAARINLICRFNDDEEKGYYGVIGGAGVESIREMGDNKVSYFGIHIHARPNEVEKLRVLDAAKGALQGGKNGTPGIKMSQYLYVTRQLNLPGGIKYAEAMLGYWENQKEQKDLQLAQMNMEQNKKLEVESVMAKNQSEMKVITHQTNEDIRSYLAKAMIDGKISDIEYQRELEKLLVQTTIDASMQAAQNQQNQVEVKKTENIEM